MEMICTQPPLDVRCIGRIVAAAASATSTAGCWEGGEGWPHASLGVVAMDGNDSCNGDCLSKKGVEQGKRRGGIERWFFFMLSNFVIVFWLTFFNAGQLISAIVAACCCYHHGEKMLVNSIPFLIIF